jgi:glucose-1-phosphate thymidylyltransferase
MLAGIRDVLVIATPHDLKAFENLLGDGSRWGMSFTFASQARPNGLPEAYLIGEEFLAGSPSMMILGDNLLYGAELSEQLRAAVKRTQKGATLFAYRVRDPEQFGVVTFDGSGLPVSIVEKPRDSPSSWAVIGLYLMDGRAPDLARELRPSARGELEIVDLLTTYLERGELEAERLGRGVSWLDTGTPHALLQAAKFVEVLQERQGLQIACPEEIAFGMGYIDAESLARLAEPLGRTTYGEYLRRLARGEEPGTV